MKRRKPSNKQLKLTAEKIRDLTSEIRQDQLGQVAGGRLRPTEASGETQLQCC